MKCLRVGERLQRLWRRIGRPASRVPVLCSTTTHPPSGSVLDRTDARLSSRTDGLLFAYSSLRTGSQASIRVMIRRQGLGEGSWR